jgi:hypothetical protein
MNDDRVFDDLERVLHDAPILATAAFGRHGAHRSYLVVLSGGIGVLGKPADTIGDGDVIVGREAAAWTIAREFGWGDLLGCTIRRTIDSPDSGQPVAASLQVLWPDVRPDADIGLFGEDDTWRAAAFDAVISHEDRMNHNWLLVPDSGAGPSMLKLVDHGYGFGPGLKPPSSSFYEKHRGSPIPEPIRAGLERIAHPRQARDLEDLLSGEALEGVKERAAHLAETGLLEL